MHYFFKNSFKYEIFFAFTHKKQNILFHFSPLKIIDVITLCAFFILPTFFDNIFVTKNLILLQSVINLLPMKSFHMIKYVHVEKHLTKTFMIRRRIYII